MKFIEPDLVNASGLSVGQNDGFANKLGLGLIQLGEDCARSRFGAWHDLTRIGLQGVPRRI